MPHPTDVFVGRKVRESRISKGISQQRLGDHLGVSFQQVQKYERGINRIGCSKLWEISKMLGTPIEYFFEGLGGQTVPANQSISGRTIKLAGQIDAIPDREIRDQVLRLIQACSKK